MKPECPTIARKPYQAPKLIVYGDLTDMTKAVGKAGMKDGGIVKGMKNTA